MPIRYDGKKLVFEYDDAGQSNLTQEQMEELHDALEIECDVALERAANEKAKA